MRHRRVADGDRDTRPRDDQGNAQRRVVGEQSVRHLAVLAQRFTMVGRDDRQRVVEGAGSPEAREEATERGVGERHLVVVRVGHALLGRVVRLVRIEQVGPSEPRRRRRGGATAGDPVRGSSQDFVGAALDEVGGERSCDAVEPVVVLVEPLAQTEA